MKEMPKLNEVDEKIREFSRRRDGACKKHNIEKFCALREFAFMWAIGIFPFILFNKCYSK